MLIISWREGESIRRKRKEYPAKEFFKKFIALLDKSKAVS